MSTTPLAATASNARQRLASSLAALQQDPNLPAAILEIVSGLARAMGPLFQVERGTGEPTLLFTARGVLQETLARMQTVDQSYPGVADATGAIAQSLGMIFAAIRDHGIVDPSNPRASARATATADEPERFPLTALRYVLDPETPDVRGDDAEVPLTTMSALRVTAGLRDAYTVDVDGLTLPWNVLARSALRAWLSRQGAATGAEYVALAACPVVVASARDASPACNDACVLAACRRAVANLGTTFENAVATLDPPRTTVNLRASATPTAAAGTLTVDQLVGLASGSFREDATSAAMAAMTLTRVADP